MTAVRSYVRGPERKDRTDNVHYELWLEPILRQLYRDVQCAVEMEHERGIVFDAFPELQSFPLDGGMIGPL